MHGDAHAVHQEFAGSIDCSVSRGQGNMLLFGKQFLNRSIIFPIAVRIHIFAAQILEPEGKASNSMLRKMTNLCSSLLIATSETRAVWPSGRGRIFDIIIGVIITVLQTDVPHRS